MKVGEKFGGENLQRKEVSEKDSTMKIQVRAQSNKIEEKRMQHRMCSLKEGRDRDTYVKFSVQSVARKYKSTSPHQCNQKKKKRGQLHSIQVRSN